MNIVTKRLEYLPSSLFKVHNIFLLEVCNCFRIITAKNPEITPTGKYAIMGKRLIVKEKKRAAVIMKEIKASIFVCRVMFAQMDVYKPFTLAKEVDIDAEELMISQDFIPELIPAISQCYAEKHMPQLEDLFRAYEFMMHRSLEGINYAVEIASGGQIVLDLDTTIYNTGNIFDI